MNIAKYDRHALLEMPHEHHQQVVVLMPLCKTWPPKVNASSFYIHRFKHVKQGDCAFFGKKEK